MNKYLECVDGVCPITPKNLHTTLSQTIKGDIEVTESLTQYHIYITTNFYCYKTFFSYIVDKKNIHLYSLYSLSNFILRKYEEWIKTKAFY